MCRHATRSNLSSAFDAKRSPSGLRPRPTKLTTKTAVHGTERARAEVDADEDRRRVRRDARTAVVVSPRGVPSSATVVTIATPDGNEAMISKNDCREIGTESA